MTYYYVAGTDNQHRRKITAFNTVQGAWDHAAKWSEIPLQGRPDALAYMAHDDASRIAEAETQVAEAETWANEWPQ